MAAFGRSMAREPAIVREIRACTECREALPLPPRPILQFSRRAPILITSQAPGIRAHEAGRTFWDPSGDRLRDWLGVSRDVFYDPSCFAIVPMGFCYPGTGAGGDLPPRPECAPRWHPRLVPRLGEPKLVLYVGAYALRHYLADRWQGRVTDVVAAWREIGPRVVPLPHPSGRNQGWLRRNAWFEAELLPALRRRVRRALASRSSDPRRTGAGSSLS